MAVVRLLALVPVLLVSGCVALTSTSGRVVLQDRDTRVAVSFTAHDRSVIEAYYRERRRSLPPGLAKRRENLPPGLVKHGRLPPGLRREPLPYDLERRLTRLPSGYVRVRVGQDIVLIDGRTHVAVDILYGVGM